MPVLLPNVTLNTARMPYSPATGQSGPALPYLTSQSASFTPIPAHRYTDLPAIALSSEFEANVEQGLDIQIGDYVTAVTLPSGQGWPGISAQDTLHVIYTEDSPPPFLPSRFVYITRVRTGGPPL